MLQDIRLYTDNHHNKQQRSKKLKKTACKIWSTHRKYLTLHRNSEKHRLHQRENSSVGRARPCQGRGRGFESRFSLNEHLTYLAKIAQLVEHDLAKVGVAGSSPVFRSKTLLHSADHVRVVELVDTLL